MDTRAPGGQAIRVHFVYAPVPPRAQRIFKPRLDAYHPDSMRHQMYNAP
jgi:hypothetical protein